MQYEEDPERAAEMLRMIVPALARLKLAANPINYALWYEYLLGHKDELCREIEQIDSGERPYSAELAESLFETHLLTPGAERMERLGQDITRIVAELIQVVGELGVDTRRFDNRLVKAQGGIGSHGDMGALREVVEQLLGETQRMLDSNDKFRGQLEGTSSDIELLRQELAEIRQQVSRDPLTLVANRRAFDEALEQAVRKAELGEQPFCVIMSDIDHFKEINDEHGHLIGDKVIKFVASTFKRLVRGGDFVARYGGEEFAVILDNTPEAGALTVADNVRKAMETSNLKRTDPGAPIRNVTISLGVSRYARGDTAEAVLERADRALYMSKKGGRNRVSFGQR
jgi:diguanylate cyclase